MISDQDILSQCIIVLVIFTSISLSVLYDLKFCPYFANYCSKLTAFTPWFHKKFCTRMTVSLYFSLCGSHTETGLTHTRCEQSVTLPCHSFKSSFRDGFLQLQGNTVEKRMLVLQPVEKLVLTVCLLNICTLFFSLDIKRRF